jgi:23S rRNA pseudouridine955/2504/2580 synthase
MSGVQTLRVGEGEGEARLDRWLRRRFPHLTQGAIEKMCRKGELRVAGARATPATRVAEGQEVRVPPLGPAASTPAPPVPRGRLSQADEEMIQGAVIWKDEHLIALNSPRGCPRRAARGRGTGTWTA